MGVERSVTGQPGDDRSLLYVVDRVAGSTERLETIQNGTAVPIVLTENPNVTPPITISDDGRYVAFPSDQSTLVAGDTNNATDIFLFDRDTDSVERVNLGSSGQQISGTSAFNLGVSGGARHVVFASDDSGVVIGDTNGQEDVFVRDRQLGTTERVSVATDGTQLDVAAGLSVDGGQTISNDGRVVAFATSAGTLVPNDTNGSTDVFVHDRQLGTTERVSVNSDGQQGNGSSALPVLSADGRTVLFSSRATNLFEGDATDGNPYNLDLFAHDRNSGTTVRVNANRSGDTLYLADPEYPNDYGIDASGRYAVFGGDPIGPTNPLLADLGDRCDVTAAGNRTTVGSGDFHLLALPCDPPAGTTIGTLFSDDVSGTYGTDWQVFLYDTDAATPRYVDPGIDGQLSSGDGFWFVHTSSGSRTLDLPAGSRQAASNTEIRARCNSPIGCRSLALTGRSAPPSAPGARSVSWSLQGNPSSAEQASVPFDALRVTTGTGVCASTGGCTLDAAATPAVDVLANVLFTYQGGPGYEAVSSGDTLPSWHGFWAGELPAAVSNGPALLFPER